MLIPAPGVNVVAVGALAVVPTRICPAVKVCIEGIPEALVINVPLLAVARPPIVFAAEE